MNQNYEMANFAMSSQA